MIETFILAGAEIDRWKFGLLTETELIDKLENLKFLVPKDDKTTIPARLETTAETFNKLAQGPSITKEAADLIEAFIASRAEIDRWKLGLLTDAELANKLKNLKFLVPKGDKAADPARPEFAKAEPPDKPEP